MDFTIRIILRAVCLVGVSTAYLVTSLAASTLWQSMQFMLRAAALKPMVPMNSATVSPRRTCTFLKISSAIWGFSCGVAWLFADAKPRSNTAVIAMALTMTRLDSNFISPSLPCRAPENAFVAQADIRDCRAGALPRLAAHILPRCNQLEKKWQCPG